MLAGAIIGFLVGSGVATGQELIQYYTPYGRWAFGTAAVIALILIVANYGFAYAGHRGNFDKGSEVFAYYCGPLVGKVFDWFSVLFCYLSYIVMVGGGSSTLQQQYGVPLIIGALLVAGLAAGTVAFGLNSVVNIVSKIGVGKVILVTVIGVIALKLNIGNLFDNTIRVEANQVPMIKAADNWLLSGISNGGFCILWLAGYVATLGAKVDYKTLLKANVLASIVLVIVNMIIGFALLTTIDKTVNLQIPNLYLAQQIWTPLADIFGLLIFVAIYSTACPLLWTASSRFTTEGTAKFRLFTVILAGIGLIVALYTPYNILMNYIYVINGYLGAALLLIMVIRMVIMRVNEKKQLAGA